MLKGVTTYPSESLLLIVIYLEIIYNLANYTYTSYASPEGLCVIAIPPDCVFRVILMS